MNLKNKQIAVLCGGFSDERAVSLRSGEAVFQSLERLGYSVKKIDTIHTGWENTDFDFAVIMLHGSGGEDGSIQAYLDCRNIPYLGSSASSSALAMNKVYTKQIFDHQGISHSPYQIEVNLEHQLEYPVVVKPIANGSSVGVSILDDEAALKTWINKHDKEKTQYFMEQYISGREVTLSIIEANDKIEVLPILELRPKNRFYDYHAKYTDGMTEFLCPAKLNQDLETMLKNTALLAYQSLKCQHFARVDIRIDESENIFVLEVNTLPGFTDLSDLPAQARAAGYSFDVLIEALLESA